MPVMKGMDFFLTAHQGLKERSKALLYRCLVNDDSNTSPLDRDTLRRVTYLLSFHYGTAPKAIRDVSILRYSQRQVNRIHGVLERLVDSSLGDVALNEPDGPSVQPPVKIQQEIDVSSGKCVYGFAIGPREKSRSGCVVRVGKSQSFSLNTTTLKRK